MIYLAVFLMILMGTMSIQPVGIFEEIRSFLIYLHWVTFSGTSFLIISGFYKT